MIHRSELSFESTNRIIGLKVIYLLSMTIPRADEGMISMFISLFAEILKSMSIPR